MKAVKMASGKVKLTLITSEFEALQAIIKAGFKEARKAAESKRGFGSFENGIETVDAPKRPAPVGAFGRTAA
jgi:DNA-binding protein YbaB